MRKIVAFSLVVLLLAGMFSLTGCGSNNRSPAATETTAAVETTAAPTAPEVKADARLGDELPKPAPANPSKTALNLSLPQGVANLDPHNYVAAVDYMVSKQIYEALLFRDDQSIYHPQLATDYTMSDDGLTYTFTLRKGVKFTNGEVMTAADVVYSFQRAAQKSQILATNVAPIDSVSKVDDGTVQFKLKYKCAPFLGDVAAVAIVNAKQCEAAGDKFGDQPCGTGPYMLDSQTANISLSLKANPDYWWGAAQIQKVNFKVITDPSSAYLAFQAGELDEVQVPTANWQDVKASGKWATQEVATTAVSYIQYNNEVEPFKNKLVRQAINYAISRDDMLAIAMDGLGKTTSVMSPPEFVFGATNDCTQYTYDPEKAKQLLKEAGYPNGFDGGAILTIAGYFEKMASVLQQNLADVGIKTRVETREFSSYLDDVMKGNYTLSTLTVSLDPDMDAYDVLYDTATINNLNMARYSNKQVDDLFAQGKSATDPEKRKEIYKQIIQIVQDDAVYAPCFDTIVPIAYNKQLTYKNYISSVRLYECSWNQ